MLHFPKSEADDGVVEFGSLSELEDQPGSLGLVVCSGVILSFSDVF